MFTIMCYSVYVCVCVCVCVCADPLTCPDRKQRERMAELQERRRGLQALLSTRLAELRCICLQEAVSYDIIRLLPLTADCSPGLALIDCRRLI